MKLFNGYDKKKPAMEFRTMTRDEVLSLGAGERVLFRANDGTVRQLKINGAVRTWKRDPNRVAVSIKYGMYEFATLSLAEAMERLLVKEPSVEDGQ